MSLTGKAYMHTEQVTMQKNPLNGTRLPNRLHRKEQVMSSCDQTVEVFTSFRCEAKWKFVEHEKSQYGFSKPTVACSQATPKTCIERENTIAISAGFQALRANPTQSKQRALYMP